MKIYRNEVEIADVVVSDRAASYKELMSHDYKSVNFTLADYVAIKKNDSIIVDDVTYWLDADATPTINKETGGYEYSLQFHSIIRKFKDYILKFDNNGTQEVEFTLTHTGASHLSLVVAELQRDGLGTFTIGQTPPEYKTITYSCVSVFDALNMIAEEYGLEWWMDGDVFNLGKCKLGTEIELQYDRELDSIEYNQASEKTVTRLYAFGSTRNIPTDYRNPSGAAYTASDNRLRMRNNGVAVDYVEIAGLPTIEGVQIFEDIYPRQNNAVDAVTVEVVPATETTIETFFYRIKDSDGLVLTQNDILPGLPLKLQFTSGLLNGRDFELILKEIDGTTWYEIKYIQEGNTVIPNGVLKPAIGDTYTIYNFNPTGALAGMTTTAEQELYDRAVETLQNMGAELVYNVPTRSIYCEDHDIDLEIGQSVALKMVYGNEEIIIHSRILSYEKNLHNKYEATYSVGDSSKYSRIGSIEKSVKGLSNSEPVIVGGGSGGAYIITQNDNTTPSDFNLFSALRSKLEHVSRRSNDTVEGLLSFTKGMKSANFAPGFFGQGFSIHPMRDALGNILPSWEAVFEYMTVTKKATFKEIIIEQLSHVGGALILSPAAIKCTAVENILDTDGVTVTNYRCFFDNTEVPNRFAVGDQALCQDFSISGSKRYWRYVNAVGDDYIDLSVTDCETGSDVPEAEDEIIMLGNRIDPARQSAILLTSYGIGGPTFQMVTNVGALFEGEVTPYTLENREEIRIAPKNSLFSGTVIVAGADGKKYRVPRDINVEWTAGTTALFYDRYPYKGSLWLCVANPSTTLEPNETNTSAWVKQVSKGEPGPTADYYSYAFLESDTQPARPTGTSKLPAGWSDAPDNLGVWWMSVALINGVTGLAGEWSYPIQVTGANGNKFPVRYAKNTSLTEPPAIDRTQLNPGIDWFAVPPAVGLGEYLWMTTAEMSTKNALVEGNTFDDTFDDTFYGATGLIAGKVDALVTQWTVPVRISGENGEPGVDGKSVEFIFQRNNSEIPPTPTPESVNEDDYVPAGWTDNPVGADGVNQYEYVCKRIKSTSGTWGAWSAPSLWARYSVDGVDGKDGTDYEYIFRRTINDVTPATPETAQEDDYVPAGWTDNAMGVMQSYPYEWICKRTKENKVWSAFSTPALWAKYGADGQEGLPSIMAVLTNDFHSIPSLSDGSGQVYTNATTTLKLFVGGVETTEGVTYDFIAGPTVTITKSGNVCTITGLSADTGYVTCNAVYNGKTYTKTFKLAKNKQGQTGDAGVNAVNGVLTNDAATLPASSDGVVSSYTPASGIFKMYYGLADVTSSSSFTAVATNCTGTINATTGAYSVTNLPAANATGYLTLKGVYNGVEITRIFSVSKALTGAKGTNAILYQIEPDSVTIKKNAAGAFTPATMAFKFYTIDGTVRSAFSGYFKTYYSTNGSTFTAIASGQATSASVTPQSTNIAIKCELYTDSGYTNMVDTQMVVIIADGAKGDNAIVGMLTNDAVTLSADSTGAVTDYTPATGTFKVYEGAVDVTTSATFAASAVNCSGSIGSTTGNYLISSFPAAKDTAYLTLTATYKGVTLTRVFSLSKAKAGANGSPSVVYKIIQSASVLVKNGTVFTPSTLTFGFYRTTGSTQESFSGYGVTSYSTDGSQFYGISGGEGQASGITVTPQPTWKAIKCSLYADSSKSVLLDSQTILIVSDGVAATRYFLIDGLSVIIKNGSTYSPSSMFFYPRMQTGAADPVVPAGCKFALYGYKTETTYDTLIAPTVIVDQTSFSQGVTSTYIKYRATLLSASNALLDEQWVSVTEDAKSAQDSISSAIGYTDFADFLAQAAQKPIITGEGMLNAALIKSELLITDGLIANKIADLAGARITKEVATFTQQNGVAIQSTIGGNETSVSIRPDSLPEKAAFLAAVSLSGQTNLPAVNDSAWNAQTVKTSIGSSYQSIPAGINALRWNAIPVTATISVNTRNPQDLGRGCGLSVYMYARFYQDSTYLTDTMMGSAYGSSATDSYSLSGNIPAGKTAVPSGANRVYLMAQIYAVDVFSTVMPGPTCTMSFTAKALATYFLNGTGSRKSQISPDGMAVSLDVNNFMHIKAGSSKMVLSYMGEIDSNSIAFKLLTMSVAASGLIVNVGGYMKKAGFSIGTSITKVNTGIWRIQHDIKSNFNLSPSDYIVNMTIHNGNYNIPGFMYISAYDTTSFNWTEVRAMNKDGVLIDTEFYIMFTRI